MHAFIMAKKGKADTEEEKILYITCPGNYAGSDY